MVLALQGLSDSSQLKQFEQLPNFFFKDLGETRLFHEDWKLVSYVDLGENLVIKRNINTAISKMSLRCIQVKELTCEQNALALSKKLSCIIRDRKCLYASLGYKYNEKRKRGIFNFIGVISKTLFRTMRASDAEYYNSEIDKVYSDNKKFATLVQNQTQILKLTIQNTENLNNREVIELIKITEYLEICISEYDQTINTLINIVLAAISGQINPQLLEPGDLKTSLEYMGTVLGISRMPLPVDVSRPIND
ncbi:hypothetical protein M0802_012239 [Mischocyttarus mexicanus]|nr:hypothetical protein M0802_012239 [Mischocyttarus mexicanus]